MTPTVAVSVTQSSESVKWCLHAHVSYNSKFTHRITDFEDFFLNSCLRCLFWNHSSIWVLNSSYSVCAENRKKNVKQNCLNCLKIHLLVLRDQYLRHNLKKINVCMINFRIRYVHEFSIEFLTKLQRNFDVYQYID